MKNIFEVSEMFKSITEICTARVFKESQIHWKRKEIYQGFVTGKAWKFHVHLCIFLSRMCAVFVKVAQLLREI